MDTALAAAVNTTWTFVLDERAVLASSLKIVHQHPFVLRAPMVLVQRARAPSKTQKRVRTVPVDTSVWPQDANAFTQLREPSDVSGGAAGVMAQRRGCRGPGVRRVSEAPAAD